MEVRQSTLISLSFAILTLFRWFDETPLGRIVSRFTNDMQIIDSVIYNSIWVCGETATSIATRLFGVILFSPIFVIPSMLAAYCGFVLGNIYLRCQLAIRRETRCADKPIHVMIF